MNILEAIKDIFLKTSNKVHLKIYRYLKRAFDFGLEIERYQSFNENTLMHSTVKILPNAKVENLARNRDLISIGKGSVIRGDLLIFPHSGKIEIGEFSYIGEGSRIWSAASMRIGSRVYISHNVNVHDTNSHSTNSRSRYKHFTKIMSEGHPDTNEFDIQSKPVYIEDDVWIGFNSTVLKGVRIGKGSIVAACSVVVRDVPESVIVAGNPAKVVKRIALENNSNKAEHKKSNT